MSEREQELARALQATQERIAQACRSAGRSADEVTLIVVTKYFPASDLAALVQLGVTDIGENRHQEAGAKLAELAPQVRASVRAHFIGQLQSNKAGAVARYADVVQSVDRMKVARALSRAADELERTLEVTLQVDLGGDDANRGGVRADEVMVLADEVASLDAVTLRGVMAVAPLGEDPAPAFDRLARIHHEVRSAHPGATWMSAGMSGDLEHAIAAGATHLRVGSAILGSRPPQR